MLSPEQTRQRILKELENPDGTIVNPERVNPYGNLVRGELPLPMVHSKSELLKRNMGDKLQDLYERAVLTILGHFVERYPSQD